MSDRMEEIIDNSDEWQGHPTMLGHPKGLFYLFFAELWERFSFYGMRALLTLYLINELFADLANGKEFAYGIYAAYGSLVYFTPAIGGMVADRLIGHKNSIMLGGLLMTLGHFTMAFEDKTIFFLSLGLLIIGNGFFKPNISTMVGGLYKQGDPKRDAGFTIFYMGINMGAFIAPLICGWLGASYGWHYGFGAAGIGMLAGVLVFWNGSKNNIYGNQGEQPAEFKDKKYFGLLNIKHIVYILALASAPLFAFLVKQNSYIVFPDSPLESGLMTFLLFSLLIVVAIFLAYTCIKSDKVTRERLIVVAILTFFITIFWSFFEQAGSSLTVFAQDHVNLIGLNAAQTNSINPGYIMIFAIPFSMIWVWLDKKRLNPNTPMKFALGIAQLGLGFLIFAMSSNYMDSNGMVAMSFLMLGYLFITTGELFVSPVGLSKVTELSPAKLIAFMMGVWFLSSAFAHHISGVISKLTIGGDGHEDTATTLADNWLTSAAKSIAGTPADGASQGAVALFNYTTVFGQIAIISFIFAAIAIVLSPLIKKMMHGIK
jgi:proton-dependent oligopeptide transporter, POT family